MAMTDNRGQTEAMNRGVRSRIAANVTLISILAIVVAVFVNYGAQKWSRSHDVRFDLSVDQERHLDDSTKSLVRGLEDPIEIYLVHGIDQVILSRAKKRIQDRDYDTGIVQSYYVPFIQSLVNGVSSLVQEVQELNANVVYRVADHSVERELPDTWRRRLGLGANQLLNNVVFYNLRTKAKKIIPLYSFYDCDLGGPDATLAFLAPKVRGLLIEQRLVQGFRSVIGRDQKNVYIVGGHQERALQTVAQLLQDDKFRVAYLEPEGDQLKIPADTDLLMIFSPGRAWPAGDRKALEDYVRGGGRLFLTQGADCAEPFVDLLERGGLRMEHQQIGHESHSRTQAGIYWLYGSDLLRPARGLPHPSVAPTVSDGLPIDLGFSRSYSLLRDYEQNLIQRDPLLRSTEGAVSMPWIYDGQEWRQAPERGTELGDFSLAAAITYRRGPDLPPGKLAVFGSDDWLTSAGLMRRSEIANVDVLFNVVYWLTDSEQMIMSTPRKFRGALVKLDGGRGNALRFLIMGVIPGLIVLGGLLVFLIRRR